MRASTASPARSQCRPTLPRRRSRKRSPTHLTPPSSSAGQRTTSTMLRWTPWWPAASPSSSPNSPELSDLGRRYLEAGLHGPHELRDVEWLDDTLARLRLGAHLLRPWPR